MGQLDQSIIVTLFKSKEREKNKKQIIVCHLSLFRFGLMKFYNNVQTWRTLIRGHPACQTYDICFDDPFAWMLIDNSKRMLDHNIDISSRFEESQDITSFHTSTPIRLQKLCQKCWKKCFEIHLFGIHNEMEPDELATWQAAPLLGPLEHERQAGR